MSQFAPRCLSIDLEVGLTDARIHQFGAIRGDRPEIFLHYGQGDLDAALEQLDSLADDVSFLLGHNLIAFDLPHLAAAKPGLRLLQLPVVDTLWLNPLAFPRNPYHHLVKHYQDGQLQRDRLNDPLLDARLTLEVFRNQQTALAGTSPDLVLAWHWLTTVNNTGSGLDRFFMSLRHKARPGNGEAQAAIRQQFVGRACQTQSDEDLNDAVNHGWALAYALAWLSVAEGGNSVMPPWVRHQFPQAGALIRRLRDTACADPACAWCRERHDAQKELTRWFGFPEFRPEPADDNGRPLQQNIVEAAMRGEHVLGILPTGTGKSLCYQIPALSRFDKTGALTVVISPLVALMADQIAGLEAKNIKSCAALNGLLSMPERADVLDRVRLGDIGILVVSPEQLRNRTLRKVLAQREIGAWVLDEAHCLSKWGQDFRPDYRYVGRFIREKAATQPDQTVPPVLCLTATAKPDVVVDILAHFRDKVGIELTCFNGGASRTNLDFCVVPTSPAEKFSHIHQILAADLPAGTAGGAIVYCATRKQTEDVADFLQQKDWAVGHFHAKLPPETKKTVQKTFIEGGLRVIAATNAFGMGIDKPDVRLVIHADIPGSLENYLQEAGRAGRDRQAARCVLLYTEEDVERQFGMSARSRLTQKEIQTVLRSLRTLEGKKRKSGDLIATSGEILAEDEDGIFERDSATDDTRVRTAVSWLEEATLLSREENHVQIFPSSLRVASIEEATRALAKRDIAPEYRNSLLAIVAALIGAPVDEGISTDELMAVSGLSSEKIRAAFYDLESMGLASNDTALTAYVHVGVERSSRKRFEQASALESALIALLREQHPDLGRGEHSILHLRHANQHLKDGGFPYSLPERLRQILGSLAADGRDEAEGRGSLKLRRIDAESIAIELQREWSNLEATARRRCAAAERVLEHLLACLPATARGNDQLAETTLGQLLAALESDLVLKAEREITPKLLDRALLWLHEQEIIRLNKGLAVFRPAMTIRLEPDWKKKFTQPDFAPLKLHYDEQVVQIHVMAEYVQRGLKAMAEALHLTMDYFSLQREEFMRRWLPERDKELARQTTPKSWHDIVEVLNDKAQRDIVADDRENTNVLVLAGPGSGKTRVLVHRIAYLVRVRRENPRGILALAYNRHAAVQIRQRLGELIGDDARGVAVLTLHALAMRLVGASLVEKSGETDGDVFKRIVEQAVSLLKGEDLLPEEADQQRDRLLAGFRWILVDEYQDIAPEQYDLISALAGRTRSDEEGRINLFAVGDDDQNIYAFNGASVAFIRRFEADYAAKPAYLVRNYRSSAHIIEAANRMIAPAANRMKKDYPIRIDSARSKQAPGGEWKTIDPVGQGRVQILAAGGDERTQAMAVMAEFERISRLTSHWDWARCAVIAREWKSLDPVRSYCEVAGIPVQQADEDSSGFWSLRETRSLVTWLRERPERLIDATTIGNWLAAQPDERWWRYLREAQADYAFEVGKTELPLDHFLDWLAEWGREARRRQTGLLLLTAHKAKGLEFDHVAVLDGNWLRTGSNEDADAPRRLYYVAMTRARQTLVLARFARRHAWLDELSELGKSPAIVWRPPTALPSPRPELAHRYLRPSWKEINLDFSGTRPPAHPIHQAIAALSIDDPLTLQRTKSGAWGLCSARGEPVGRLSGNFSPPSGMHCVDARVASIHERRLRDVGEEHKSRINEHCTAWEIIVPELVFAPDEPIDAVAQSHAPTPGNASPMA